MASINLNISSPILETNNNKESQAYKLLKEVLDTHLYPPGSIITERKLSETYSMSRTPIRAALRQLTYEGLLQYIPGKGIIIPEYNIEDILEVYELIESLHLYAVKRCIKHLDQIPMEHLGNIVANMKEALDTCNMDSFVQADKDFHSFLISHAGNQRLAGIYMPLDNQSAMFKANVSEDISQAERSYKEHHQIYHTVCSKDTPAAESAVKDHYQSIRQYHINKLISSLTL